MSKLIVIWHKPQPETFKRVLLRLKDGRSWRHIQNWKINKRAIILPFFRLVRYNGSIEVGLGNHYLEFGW